MTDFSSHARPRRSSIDALIFGAGCLAMGAACFTAWQASSELSLRRAEVARVVREADDATRRLRDIDAGRGSTEGALAAQAEGTLDAPPPRVVAELSSAMPADVRLESVDLDYRDRVFVDLRVRARTPQAYDAFLERLSKSGRFREIVPGPETRSGEVTASIRASYAIEPTP